MKRLYRGKGLVLLVAVLSFFMGMFIFMGRTEREIRRVVEEVLEAVEIQEGQSHGERDQRIQQVLEQHVGDPVAVTGVDLPKAGAGKRALLIWARLLHSYPAARLTLGYFEVTGEGAERRVNMKVRVELSDGPDEVVEERPVRLTLRNAGGRWLVTGIVIEQSPNDIPEARP